MATGAVGAKKVLDLAGTGDMLRQQVRSLTEDENDESEDVVVESQVGIESIEQDRRGTCAGAFARMRNGRMA